MLRRFLITVAALTGLAAPAAAQPFPQIPLPPQTLPASSPIDGQWFFRGDPYQPCYVQTVASPYGTRLIFTNEKGTSADARLSPDARHVTIPSWNLVGTVNSNSIIWPNGDFWAR